MHGKGTKHIMENKMSWQLSKTVPPLVLELILAHGSNVIQNNPIFRRYWHHPKLCFSHPYEGSKGTSLSTRLDPQG
jgi:hypothetical protein